MAANQACSELLCQWKGDWHQVGTAGALTLASTSCGDGEQREPPNAEEHDDEVDSFVAGTHINCKQVAHSGSQIC